MRLARSDDISIDWTSLLMKIVGLWMAADRAEQRRRNFALIYTITIIVIATSIAFRDIYFSWGNLNDCVFVSCNILYLMFVFFKIVVLYVHRIEFFALVRYTQKNFWHSNYDPREKVILADCKRVCAIFIVVISFCTQGTCAGYVMTPLFANVGKNHSDRILPFNMWVKFPVGISPYYEISFLIQTLCVYHVAVGHICFDYFLSIVNLHVTCQFRILQYRLLSLGNVIETQTDEESLSRYTNVCLAKLRGCIQQHQALTEYCRRLENIFTLIILAQVLFLSIVLCLISYQLFLVNVPHFRNISLVMNMIGILCMLFMFTYSCDGLIRQSTNVGRVTFLAPWSSMSMNKAGKTLRQNILITIMRSNQSCRLTASGYFPISLETYTGVLSTAMSYFTLLRHKSLNVEVH
ncbi:Putative odorant receptor 13a [Dufourea novaeangliae]|uniref:Odorant receptor n=1 Tax=Dufourea novaeangliae TaxID=178035 RepID=A0A154P2B7_DUFNO|nr:Putative odorant receptor 13a [Dufourea novaeangliae]